MPTLVDHIWDALAHHMGAEGAYRRTEKRFDAAVRRAGTAKGDLILRFACTKANMYRRLYNDKRFEQLTEQRRKEYEEAREKMFQGLEHDSEPTGM